MFYALVRMQDSRPKVVDDLKRKNDELKRKFSRLHTEHDQLRTDFQQLVRVVHVLEVESQQLRKSAGRDGVVRVLPIQNRPTDRSVNTAALRGTWLYLAAGGTSGLRRSGRMLWPGAPYPGCGGRAAM